MNTCLVTCRTLSAVIQLAIKFIVTVLQYIFGLLLPGDCCSRKGTDGSSAQAGMAMLNASGVNSRRPLTTRHTA